MKNGYLSFVNPDFKDDSVANVNHSNCNKGDECKDFAVYDTYRSIDKNKNLCILLNLRQKTFYRGIYRATGRDGSIEKIVSMEFYFVLEDGNRFYLNKWNKNSNLEITCSKNSRDGKYLVFSNGFWYPYDIPHCSQEFPVKDIDDFITLFNNKSGELDAIERYSFYFIFDKAIFVNIKSEPINLVLKIKMQNNYSRRTRSLKIIRKLKLSNLVIM